MKTYFYILIVVAELALLSGCTPTPVPSTDPVNNNSPALPGSNPALQPSICASGQFPTTAGGCISLLKVNLFTLTNSYSVIGFTRFQNSDAVLLERTNGSFQVWDLYSLPDSTQMISSVVPICSFVKPGAYYDSFGGLNYSGGLFHTISIGSGTNGVTRVYDISPISCLVSQGMVLQLGNDSCPEQTRYLLFDGSSFVYSYNCALYKQNNTNSIQLNFTNESIGTLKANVTASTRVTLTSEGSYWSNSKYTSELWHINSFGVPVGWFQLPDRTYYDLSNVSGMTWTSSNHLHIFTMSSSNALKVYDFDLTKFSKGAQ